MRRLALRLAGIVALGFVIALGGSALAGQQPQVLRMHGPDVHRVNRKSKPRHATPLIYHGGFLLPEPNIHAIYWGPAANFPSDLQTGLDDFFSDFAPTGYSEILTQYLVGSIGPLKIDDSLDTSTPPRTGPSVSTIVNEACRVITAASVAPDSNGIYFVFTSNFPHISYCGYHAWGSCTAKGVTATIEVSYIPNPDNVAGCTLPNVFGVSPNNYSIATQSTVDTTAHELAETITDPQGTGWIDKNGQEIGDKCAWMFADPVSLAEGSMWQVQELWSNSAGACMQD